MFKRSLKRVLSHFGYKIHRISAPPASARYEKQLEPPPVAPIWPLPRRSDKPSDEEIRAGFARYGLWHYAYEFEGGLSFPARHNNPGPLTDAPERPLQRFRHFMPYLVESQGGTLKGKRILDIACNSGFWSIQCALLGAEVVGFDARNELIEQADMIKAIVGVNNVAFKVLDFWEMSPQSLGGTFDVALNLGILYHLPKPPEALELTKSVARKNIILDTSVYPSRAPLIKLRWEKPEDIRNVSEAGVVAVPSKGSIELMLRHLKFADWLEIPIRTGDMPRDYLAGRRASWLIKV